MSFRVYYGATGPHPAEPPGRPHSSWSTGLKHAFPRKFTWAHHGSRLLTNPCRNNCGVTMWTSLTNEGGEQQSEMHATTRRYHQRFVHSMELRAGDLVLRRILNRAVLHKLSPNWEGHFKVTEVCRPGCVRLAIEDGVPLPNPWNIEHLRKFYA